MMNSCYWTLVLGWLNTADTSSVGLDNTEEQAVESR